ncbi:MAG: lysophospholipid acyltransferase family protein [Candidatus Latescibacteria bacterium]|nr:lysophospholipid acyltransferase family protein [Candidatus Latescibacterota bacterium]
MKKRRLCKRFKHTFVYGLVLILFAFVRRMSGRTALCFGEALGRSACHLFSKEREQVREHLSIAFADLSPREIGRLSKEVFVHLGKNAVDMMRMGSSTKQELDRIVSSEGLEHLDRASEEGKGVLLLSGHIGNWELLGAYLAMKGYPLSVVGKSLNNPRLDRLLVAHRERFGLRNIARGKATRQILRALHRGEFVGFLIDQDTKVEGAFVDFFGRPAYTPTGPVTLSLKLGAPIVPVAIHRERDNTYHLVVRPRIELIRTGDETEDRRINTATCSKILEEFIREYPAQWVWMHRRWKTKALPMKNEK